MNSRVTQSDIARIAGVHNTTVSLALRNHPALPEKTRTRIQAIARDLGYCPDPALQALAAYRVSRMPRRLQGTLAYVTNWYTKWGWQHDPIAAQHYSGAQRRAEEAGFQLEHLWLGEEGMSSRRLDSMLYHRGISGLIVAAQRPNADGAIDLDWSKLSAVKIGCHPAGPSLHRVVTDYAGVMRLALQHIRAAGFERIGVVLSRAHDQLADEAWSTAFAGEQSRLPEDVRLPVLAYGAPVRDLPSAQDNASPMVPLAALNRWLQQHRPDVVITFGACVRTQLVALGHSIPNDLACVDLLLDDAVSDIAGVRHGASRQGELAVDLLIRQLQQNQRGLPSFATTSSIAPSWVEGRTLPSTSWTAVTATLPASSWHDTLLTTP
jgi:LacI family transcriptional regulator